MSSETTDTPSSSPTRSEKTPARPHWTTGDLFGDANVVVIEHLGQDYLLRITRNGRLLLNKREAF